MKSKILLGGAYYLLPVLLIFSLFLLFRGHGAPGGGFVGGLAAASGFALYAITHGRKRTKQILPASSSFICLIGILTVLLSGIFGFIFKDHFLQSVWMEQEMPVFSIPGTAILFDVGVYLVVIGTITNIILNLSNE